MRLTSCDLDIGEIKFRMGSLEFCEGLGELKKNQYPTLLTDVKANLVFLEFVRRRFSKLLNPLFY